MTRDVNQQGHTQANNVNAKSNTFENCTFHGFTINIDSGKNEEGNSVEFNSSATGDSHNTQTLQLPNDPETIIKVLRQCQNEGIHIPFVLPESIKVAAIEHKEVELEPQ